jgi:hypothetical protein
MWRSWGEDKVMKPNILSGAFAVCAIALCSFPQGANAVSVNVTVVSDLTGPGDVPIDVAPGAPNSSTGTVNTGVIGNNLSPPIWRSPFEGTAQFATAAFTAVEGPPPAAGSSATYTSFAAGNIFQIFWGSVDTFNTLTFKNGGTTIASITGGSLAPLAFGLGHDLVTLSITDGSIFDTVVVSSSVNAFEFSNLIVTCNVENNPDCRGGQVNPVPLPAALPLFASGIAGLGGLFGWRKRRKSAAKALTA